MEIEDTVKCSNCNYEIARVVLNDNSKRTLEVHRPLQLTVIDKEGNMGLWTCPECGCENRTDLSFWRRF